MFANERYELILDLLKTQHSVTVTALTKKFNVSIETIRRDLAFLESQGQLMRVHGGAISISNNVRHFNKLSERLSENSDYKHELSVKAAELVEEDDVIAIDSGSTAIEFAKVLTENFKRLTVVTYSLDIFNEITTNGSNQFKIIFAGGNYLNSERVFCGFLTEENIRRLHVSKAFISPSSLSIKYGVTITVTEFYNLYKILMGISDHLYILADSTKFETTAPIHFCSLTDVDAVVTDTHLDEQLGRLYVEKGTKLIK